MARPPTARRQRRVGDLIRQEVSRLLARHLKDRRIADLTTVTDVLVSSDLKYAKVCISVLGNARQEQSTLIALQHASGHIQQELGKVLTLRSTPKLRFVVDDRIREGDHVLALLKTMQQDADPSRTTPEDKADGDPPPSTG